MIMPIFQIDINLEGFVPSAPQQKHLADIDGYIQSILSGSLEIFEISHVSSAPVNCGLATSCWLTNGGFVMLIDKSTPWIIVLCPANRNNQ